MSRKSIISFIAVAALAVAALSSGAAQAHKNGGPGGKPGKGGWSHHHTHFVRFHERIYVRPVTYAVGHIESAPGPCTCLTKNYTPDGHVVFQDLCTKEMASAPVDGSSDQAQATDAPANFAGQTYQDYLKANPQAAPQPQKN